MWNDKSGQPRIRLFRNDILERSTLTTPFAFVAAWSIFLALGIAASWNTASPAAAIGLFVLGLVIWILFEYAMHRFFFHLEPRSAFGKRLIFLAHGNHHAAPNDALRNIMPPLISIAISSAVWGLLWLLLGPPGSFAFLGFGIGYVVYDSIHYACHQLPMRHPLLRELRKHHLRHHYAKRDGNYAITAIFLDRLFGTAVPLKVGRDAAAHRGLIRKAR